METRNGLRAHYRVISLFSGGGGLDLGFEAEGFEPEICVDSDVSACNTLRRNRPDWQVFDGDIRTLLVEGRATGVVGGPPCQGFSTAGRGKPDDPRNYLWKEYFRVVKSVRPDFVMLENVPGMINRKNHHHLDAFVLALEELGFVVEYGILNAADFGVAQNRRRLVVLGGRGFRIPLPQPTVSTHRTVVEAIRDLENRSGVPNHTPNRHAPRVVKRWSRLAEGESDPMYHRARLYANQPSTTIRAGGGYGPSGHHLAGFHPPIHYKFPRQLTVREAARLQGFDDDWVFEGPKTIQGRQVGNAVPPPLARAVAREIRIALDRHFEGRAAPRTKVSWRRCRTVAQVP